MPEVWRVELQAEVTGFAWRAALASRTTRSG